MRRIFGISRRDARKQILIGLAGQQIAIVERVAAEFGQQRIARRIGDDVEPARMDRL